MRQQSLTDDFEEYRKQTRKEQFLSEMVSIIPWKALTAAIEPYYPNPQSAGRRPIGVERMLRIYFFQHWFNLSDPAAEEALYDSRAMRHFAGIDLGQEPGPDETTICKCRHLMERHNLGDDLFHLVNQYLAENGMSISRGTIADTTIINAPSSTKNLKKERDPEMHQTRKGNHQKSKARAKGEHPYRIIKGQFGFIGLSDDIDKCARNFLQLIRGSLTTKCQFCRKKPTRQCRAPEANVGHITEEKVS